MLYATHTHLVSQSPLSPGVTKPRPPAPPSASRTAPRRTRAASRLLQGRHGRQGREGGGRKLSGITVLLTRGGGGLTALSGGCTVGASAASYPPSPTQLVAATSRVHVSVRRGPTSFPPLSVQQGEKAAARTRTTLRTQGSCGAQVENADGAGTRGVGDSAGVYSLHTQSAKRSLESTRACRRPQALCLTVPSTMQSSTPRDAPGCGYDTHKRQHLSVATTERDKKGQNPEHTAKKRVVSLN